MRAADIVEILTRFGRIAWEGRSYEGRLKPGRDALATATTYSCVTVTGCLEVAADTYSIPQRCPVSSFYYLSLLQKPAGLMNSNLGFQPADRPGCDRSKRLRRRTFWPSTTGPCASTRFR